MLTVGVDSHKQSYVAVLVDATGRPLADKVMPASVEGIEALIAWAHGIAQDSGAVHWGIEGSGSYGRPLAQRLAGTADPVYEVPAIATARERGRGVGRHREKTDRTDALAIARITLREAGRLPRIAPAGEAYQCKLLDEHRENLVLARTRALNHLYAHLVPFGPLARPLFRAKNHRQKLAALAAAPLQTDDPALATRALIIQQLARQILALDADIQELARPLKALAPRVAPSLLTIPGVRELTVVKIAGQVGDVRRFATAAKFAAYAGVAPLEASSGERRRHRLNRRGNRQLNRALHMIAVTQRRWHPIGREFLARAEARGKTRKEALRSLKRHLANVVYRLLQRDAALAHDEVRLPCVPAA
jgi:transposase